VVGGAASAGAALGVAAAGTGTAGVAFGAALAAGLAAAVTWCRGFLQIPAAAWDEADL